MARTKLRKLAHKSWKAVSLASSRVARVRLHVDPVSRTLARAPADDEELTPDERAAIDEAHAEAGPGLSLAEVRRRLHERRADADRD